MKTLMQHFITKENLFDQFHDKTWVPVRFMSIWNPKRRWLSRFWYNVWWKDPFFNLFCFPVKLGLAYVQLFWPVLRRAWHSANIRFVATLSDSVTLLIFSKSICEGRVAWTSLTRYLSTFGLFLSLIVTYLTNRLLFRWSQKASGVTIQSNLMHIHSPPTSSSTVHLVWFWLSLFFSFSPLNEFSATIKLWPEKLK